MIETDLHDLSDDADYAASQQQGSVSMMRTDSGRGSSSSEPEETEVVYSKENVTIHPTQFASERISGRLRLIKQGSCLFITWIPYKGQNSNAKLSERGSWLWNCNRNRNFVLLIVYFLIVDKNLYTIRAVPFTEVRSIRRHTPAFGWQYIIVVLSSGLAFPPLYFYNGGVREFLATVKQHVFLVRSEEDSNTFLVNDFQDPLQRTLSSLELPRTGPIASGPVSSISLDESPSSADKRAGEDFYDEGSRISRYSGKQRPKFHDPARDLPIQILEKFSLVTKFARETTSQLFRENHNNGFSAPEMRIQDQSSVDSPQRPSNGLEKVPNVSPVVEDPIQFDKMTLVWGKPRQPPLGSEEWATFLDAEGRVLDSKSLRKRIFYGGVEHNLRKEVWAFLLGYHAYDSTYAEREYLQSMKRSEYLTIKNQWQSISPEQAKRFTKFKERKGLIEKDVVRTDRSLSFFDGDENPNVKLLHDILLTYSFYNFDLGYCQGMSDFLSPILFVLGDESESFWCFVALMERLGPNFNRDQTGMHCQLFAISKLVELLDTPLHNYFSQHDCLNYFFCFRWVLIQFKREFEYEKVMHLWEVLWTHYLSEHLHLYICVAILKRYRNKIMGEQMDFDTLLKFINELSGHIDLDAAIRDAEALCVCAGENGAANIPPGTPPSLPLDDGSYYIQQDEVL
ncbi:TBC1 domain family member 15 isoform X1 [Cucurbita moschata]|uniref:TBC1 domain family member 15 n=1 Tax=Cucurbita moschata TaxID=3662 RepID=A0A6J1G3R3_CUCMO|nr:TBC1 domain family member 15 isoform X1 [Cucurbita moschata]